MLTESQWRHAESAKDRDDYQFVRDIPWFSEQFIDIDKAYDDMERIQAEFDLYDTYEEGSYEVTQEQLDEHYNHHHLEAEPEPEWKILTDNLTTLLRSNLCHKI